MKIDELINHGIPEIIIENLKIKGYKELYPPQELAIKNGVLNFKNLVIATPTASGKTLISFLASIKHFLNKNKTLYLCPLRAIASEKYQEFNDLLKGLCKVALSIGDYDSEDYWLKNYDIIISTYEKADSLMRHNAKWINDVSLFVIDEIHLLNTDRGGTLEFLIARLKKKFPSSQFLALSATIKNVEEIADWLDAEVISLNWRPVPLKEGIYKNGIIFYSDEKIKRIKTEGETSYIHLTLDSLKEKGQVLIFNNSRVSAVRCAIKLKDYVKKKLNKEEKETLKKIAEKIEGENDIAKKLRELIISGVAFHHAGLDYKTRKIIEDNFRKGVIKVISSTTTLGAGVNVPARRVIINDIQRYDPIEGYSEFLSVNEYKQLAGRAGRPKFDNYGEAIIVAKIKSDIEELMKLYIKGENEPIYSVLENEKSLRPHILSIIVNEIVKSEEDIEEILKFTFSARKNGISRLFKLSQKILKYLIKKKFVYKINGEIKASELGKRISELYIDPVSAEIIINGLREINSKLKVNEIYYLYLICSTEDMINLSVGKREIEILFNEMKKYLKNDLLSSLIKENEVYYENENIFSIFKTAKLLYDWINEEDEDSIIDKYNVGLGDVYNIIQNAKWLMYSAKEIAKLLKLKEIEKEIEIITKRIEKGVKEELLELVQIPNIGRHKARILYKAGFTNLEKLKHITEEMIIKLPGIGLETYKDIKKFFNKN